MCTSESFPFTVEVKRREGWNVARLFAGEPSPAWGWWRQAVDQACEERGVAMLWCKKNPYRPGQPSFPWLVMLPACDWVGREGIPRPDIVWTVDQLDAAQIDFAAELPALWFADRLLGVHPSAFL